jgi:hypothetical protein
MSPDPGHPWAPREGDDTRRSDAAIGRRPLSTRLLHLAALLAEASVLLALVGVVAGGVFQKRDPKPPIPLSLADLPALLVVAIYAGSTRVRRHRLAFVAATALVIAVGAFAHPDPEKGPLLSALLGIPVGGVLAFFCIPVHQLTTDMSDEQVHPWREVQVGATLAVLGALACAVRGGALLGAPAIGVGIVVLVRALRFDLPAIVRPGGRGSAFARAIAGTLALAMATGLIVVASLISVGLVEPGDSRARSSTR